MTTLYNGTLYLQGLTTTAGALTGVTTSDTILSVLNNIDYNSRNRVMMEIGATNMNEGDYGNVYKYALGYSNAGDGQGGSFHIQTCPVADGSYAAGTPVSRFCILPNGRIGLNTINPTRTLEVNGDTFLNGPLVMKTNTWHLTTDNIVRLLYDDNGATIMRSGNNVIDYRNTADAVMFRVNGGSVQFQTNTWHTSLDGHNRFYYGDNGPTYFGSGNGYVFRRSDDQLDIVRIDNDGSINAAGTISAGNFVTGGNLTAYNIYTNTGITSGTNIRASRDITADGIFYGNGGGLTNVPYANAAGTAGSAGTATYATSAGSAPANKYDPIVLYNMGGSGLNTTGLSFTRVGEA